MCHGCVTGSIALYLTGTHSACRTSFPIESASLQIGIPRFLEILTNPARVTHKKPTNILRKNTLPISLFTDYSLQIKFLPYQES